MNSITKPRFTTGEFAKICNTTKDTLFYYDKIGILKPVYTGDNGYRYYSHTQFYDFDLISILKEAGSSLKEIKNYIDEHDIDDYLKILEENSKRLAKEREKIERMERFLQTAASLTHSALSEPIGVPKLIESKEEYFITANIKNPKTSTVQNEVDAIRELFLYCDTNHISIEVAVGAIVMKDTLCSGNSYASCYNAKISEPFACDRFFVKPKGTYVTLLHKGNYDTLYEAYKILFSYIKEHCLQICGNSYEDEIIGYVAVSDKNQYIMRISIQVEGEQS